MPELQDSAVTELAKAMVPKPEDLLADIGPLGQVFYLRELGWHVLRSMTGMLSDDASKELESDDPPVIALQELSMVMGMLDATCATLSLIDPAEAVK